jgi:thiopeptide-type bacteriocin biosynthesis protein
MLEPGDAGGEERWRLALVGIDALFTDFGVDLAGRRRLAQEMRDAYARELRVDGALRGELGARFRARRRELEAVFGSGNLEGALAPALEVLRERSVRWARDITALQRAERERRLTVSVEELACSFAHMHANRLLRAAHRLQELVLYDWLARLYAVQAARAGRERQQR